MQFIVLAAPDKSQADVNKLLKDIEDLSESCMSFSNWFGTSIDNIRSGAKKDALKDFLNPVIVKVDGIVANNEAVAKSVYQEFMEAGLIKCPNTRLFEQLETLQGEALNEAYVILEGMYNDTVKFEKSVRESEADYKDEMFKKRFDAVKKDLVHLATFASNEQPIITTEMTTLRDSLEISLSAAIANNDRKNVKNLTQKIKKAYQEYTEEMQKYTFGSRI